MYNKYHWLLITIYQIIGKTTYTGRRKQGHFDVREHPFSTYAKFSENFFTRPVRNVSFSENFTNLLNE